MKKYRLYIEEDTYIDMAPEGLDNIKNVNVQYDGKELAGKQLEVTYKELKYPIIIITPLDNFLEVEVPDEKDNTNE